MVIQKYLMSLLSKVLHLQSLMRILPKPRGGDPLEGGSLNNLRDMTSSFLKKKYQKNHRLKLHCSIDIVRPRRPLNATSPNVFFFKRKVI